MYDRNISKINSCVLCFYGDSQFMPLPIAFCKQSCMIPHKYMLALIHIHTKWFNHDYSTCKG